MEDAPFLLVEMTKVEAVLGADIDEILGISSILCVICFFILLQIIASHVKNGAECESPILDPV